MTKIVIVNVSQQAAPTPATLQKCGALISQGGTNTSPGTVSLLTQLSDLTPLTPTPRALSTLAWATNVVTATTVSPHLMTIGQTINLRIAGAVAAGYNGVWPCTVTDATHFTYPLIGNPGSETVPGTWTPASVDEVADMATTFFAQGTGQSVFVLECGTADVATGVAFLSAYIIANPNSDYSPGALGFFYSYLVPRAWDANSAFLSMLASFEALTSKTYFFVTTTLATYTVYTALQKCVVAMIESPPMGVWPANAFTALTAAGVAVTATTTTAHGVAVGQWFTVAGCTPAAYNGTFQAQPGTTGSTLLYNANSAPGAETVLGTLVANQVANAGITSSEFSHASDFFVSLKYDPDVTNRVTPFEYSFLFGVTPFPTRNNSALLTTLKAANINVVGTGSEGGITNTLVVGGNTLDANPFNYWYAVDWMQITGQIDVANAVINGSNNPQNPLDYDQDGINRLQIVLARTVNRAVSFGLCVFPALQTELTATDFLQQLEDGKFVGSSPVNAVPFIAYSVANPGDFKIGKYGGLSLSFVPARGFDQIVININVSQFVAI